MKNVIYLCLAILGLWLSACESDSDTTIRTPENPSLCNEEKSLCDLNLSTNEMGWSLLKKLEEDQQEENIIISPVSISMAVAITTNGAQDDTYQEMKATMNLEDWTTEQMNAAQQSYLQNVPNLDPQDITFNIANSIWYRQGYNIKDEFISTNQTFYDSEVREIDFLSPEAKDMINGWVDNQTNGLIEEIVDQIPANAVMYLINALYFKGAWQQPFNPEQTFAQTFFKEDGSTVNTDFMSHGKITLPYLNGENFQAVDLAYGDSIFSMTVILPDEQVSMNELINSIPSSSTDWIEDFRLDTTPIFFGMPKFKLDYKVKLNDALSDLGMPKAFMPGIASFRNIAEAELSIDEAIHKTFIEVNEEGTEGAAVTSISIIETSVPTIPFVVLDRPFLFLIRENQTGSILFIGKVMNPAEK